MQPDYEVVMQAYQDFQNYIYLTCHDKIVNANLISEIDKNNNKIYCLNVLVRRRNYSTGDWLGLNSGMEYFEFLKQKHPQQWTELDIEAARVIRSAIKHFDTLDTTGQQAFYYDNFILGYKINPKSKIISSGVSESDSVAVTKSEAPKKHKEEGATEKEDYADSKNYKYPIINESHVRAALGYFGKPKNYEEYSEEERKAIARKILRAAKKYNIEVSDEWKEKFFKKSFLENYILDQSKNGKTKEEIKKSILDKVIEVSKKKYILRKALSSATEEVNVLKSWDVIGSKQIETVEKRDFSRDDMKVRFRVP